MKLSSECARLLFHKTVPILLRMRRTKNRFQSVLTHPFVKLQMAEQKRLEKRSWQAHKWVLLLSNCKKGAEDLKSVLKKINVEVDSDDCLDCYSGSRFSPPVDSKAALQGERSLNPMLCPFKLSDLREMDSCVWYHLIAYPEQTPIHLPFLINSEGVFIIVCHQADSSEDKLTYVKRTLDLITNSTKGDSVAVIDGMDHDEFERIPPKKYKDTGKFMDIVRLQEAKWNSIAEIPVCSDYLVFSDKVFRVLEDEDGKRKPLVAYRPSDGEWKDEVCIESLQSLHRLGWIYFQQQTGLEWNLVFTSPKLFHDMLLRIYKQGSSSKAVNYMIRDVCNQISKNEGYQYIKKMMRKVAEPFEELLLKLNLAVTVGQITKLVSSYSEVNIDAIRTSVAPLLVKYENPTVISQESFFKLANRLHCKDRNKVAYLKLSEVALNCITFHGHHFTLYMCHRVSKFFEFRLELCCSAPDPSHQLCDLVTRLPKFCCSVQEAIQREADFEGTVLLGFTCNYAENDVDHAKICIDKFACYNNSYLTCESSCRERCCQPCMPDQKIWFDQSLKVPCDFVKLIDTERVLLKVPHLEDPTAPRAGMDEKIGRGLDILKVPEYRKGLIDNSKCLGAVLDIEQQANAILHSNGSIDDHLLEILNLYIREKCPTWRDLCTALNEHPCFNNVREKIEDSKITLNFSSTSGRP